ncbi:MAG: divergent polysaccharide deacetylase family protein [Paracoccaceae bacterium]
MTWAPTDAPMPEALSAPTADATPDSVTPPPAPEPSPSPAPAVAAQPEPEPAPEAAEAAQPDVEPAPQDPETDTTANATQGEAGVTTGRLPQIGVEPAEPAADTAAPAQDGTPEAATAEPGLAVTPQVDPDAPGWQRYAAAFDNPSGKPLFAVILIDDGEPGRDRAAIAALPFPLTIAIDPAAPEAGAIADSYRAAGKDVLLLTTGIPVGAQPQDVEQSMQIDLAALPTAVGVMDLPQGSFQNDPVLARQVMASLGETGLAVVVHDHGLPAAAREAVNAGLPAVTAFRTLDAAGESADTIRRYLDRAAFRAAQDGHVTVVGTLAAATLEGLTEWAGTGRSDSVAMAPVSAIFALQN